MQRTSSRSGCWAFPTTWTSKPGRPWAGRRPAATVADHPGPAAGRRRLGRGQPSPPAGTARATTRRTKPAKAPGWLRWAPWPARRRSPERVGARRAGRELLHRPPVPLDRALPPGEEGRHPQGGEVGKGGTPPRMSASSAMRVGPSAPTGGASPPAAGPRCCVRPCARRSPRRSRRGPRRPRRSGLPVRFAAGATSRTTGGPLVGPDRHHRPREPAGPPPGPRRRAEGVPDHGRWPAVDSASEVVHVLSEPDRGGGDVTGAGVAACRS